jgi:predicted DNA-binding transcriptional regulator YafY
MFGGEPQNVEFIYSGPSIEAVLDKLPMSHVDENEDGTYTVHAETFGKGILMWLLSQGSNVEVIAPLDLRTDWLDEINKMSEKRQGDEKFRDIAEHER